MKHDDETDEQFEARLELELQRALARTPREVEASLLAKGYDLDELDARLREMLRRHFPEKYPLS
jgi:hypothetical protein